MFFDKTITDVPLMVIKSSEKRKLKKFNFAFTQKCPEDQLHIDVRLSENPIYAFQTIGNAITIMSKEQSTSERHFSETNSDNMIIVDKIESEDKCDDDADNEKWCNTKTRQSIVDFVLLQKEVYHEKRSIPVVGALMLIKHQLLLLEINGIDAFENPFKCSIYLEGFKIQNNEPKIENNESEIDNSRSTFNLFTKAMNTINNYAYDFERERGFQKRIKTYTKIIEDRKNMDAYAKSEEQKKAMIVNNVHILYITVSVFINNFKIWLKMTTDRVPIPYMVFAALLMLIDGNFIFAIICCGYSYIMVGLFSDKTCSDLILEEKNHIKEGTPNIHFKKNKLLFKLTVSYLSNVIIWLQTVLIFLLIIQLNSPRNVQFNIERKLTENNSCLILRDDGHLLKVNDNVATNIENAATNFEYNESVTKIEDNAATNINNAVNDHFEDKEEKIEIIDFKDERKLIPRVIRSFKNCVAKIDIKSIKEKLKFVFNTKISHIPSKIVSFYNRLRDARRRNRLNNGQQIPRESKSNE
uniref:C2 NT-type domain-containing protein n=1 Tax=Rhabditophanes sp. KR3021 TaxID=114890 RepID=A0AC35TL84_9BILA